MFCISNFILFFYDEHRLNVLLSNYLFLNIPTTLKCSSQIDKEETVTVPSFNTCKFKDQYNKFSLLDLEEEIENAYLKQEKILEEVRCNKCKRFIILDTIKKGKKK